MSTETRDPSQAWRGPLLAALAAATFAALLALVEFPPRSIWMDESWSASAAALSVMEAVVLTLRFDLHPPLYYMQLSLWGSFGQSDAWLYANSLFWGVGAVSALAAIAAHFYGVRIGLAAGLLLASLPLFADTLHSLRMYAFLTALSVLAWAAWRAAILDGPLMRWATIGVALQWAMAYSQGAGAIMAGFIGLFALSLAWEKEKSLSDLRPVLIGQILFGLGCLPALANSATRSISHTVVPDFAALLETVASLVSAAATGPAAWAAALAFMLLLIAGLLRHETRVMTMTLVLAPLVVAAIVSYAVKPIWQTRLFIFMLPFLCLVAAIVVLRALDHRRALAAVALAALVIFGSVQTILERDRRQPAQDYRALAEALQARVAPGDFVFAPRFFDYWAVMRYAVGADWGSPLAVQGKGTTDRWSDIYERLGPVWLSRLRLAPVSDRIEHDGVTYVIGPNLSQSFENAARIWVVQPPWFDEALPFAATHRAKQMVDVSGLRLIAFEPAGAPVP